jgi:hypothetical protein
VCMGPTQCERGCMWKSPPFLQEAKTVSQFIGIVKPLLLLTCLN